MSIVNHWSNQSNQDSDNTHYEMQREISIYSLGGLISALSINISKRIKVLFWYWINTHTHTHLKKHAVSSVHCYMKLYFERIWSFLHTLCNILTISSIKIGCIMLYRSWPITGVDIFFDLSKQVCLNKTFYLPYLYQIATSEVTLPAALRGKRLANHAIFFSAPVACFGRPCDLMSMGTNLQGTATSLHVTFRSHLTLMQLRPL